MKIDDTDIFILERLKLNAKESAKDIGSLCNLPTTTIYNRIKKLEDMGIIKGYSATIDYSKLGKSLIAYSFLHYDIGVWETGTNKEDLRSKLLALPSIESINYMIGQYDILLKFRLTDIQELNDILLNHLRHIPGIGQTETFFVLEEVL